MTFRILTVCTGNICRSPLAEQLLRAGLASVPGIEVSSAGTMAMVGEPMTRQSVDIAGRFGATDAAAHRARQLDESLIREADLVLGLAREHRRAVVELVPAATRKTFTLREFARLAAAVTEQDLEDALLFAGPSSSVEPASSVEQPSSSVEPVETNSTNPLDLDLNIAIRAATSLRGIVPPFATPDDADVVDPYLQSDAVYEASAAQLVPAVQATIALLLRIGVRS